MSPFRRRLSLPCVHTRGAVDYLTYMSLVVANLLVQQMVDHTKDGTMLATTIVVDL